MSRRCQPDSALSVLNHPKENHNAIHRRPLRSAAFHCGPRSVLVAGSNDPKNLWAQPYLPVPGARQKDVLETFLKRRTCSGAITLAEAQKEISTDWYAAYLKYGLDKSK
jgi:hypothetical protein